MTGPKLNEGALLVPEGQPTTKATARYLRGSASKAREVLDLIRGLDVRRADEVLQFTTRDVAQDVRKVLASAVANAVHNDAQDADELFVVAAYADEGPTLRRFRPRARGRATRIRKRTCHITVVVTRLSDDRLDVLQAREQSRTTAGRRAAGTSAQSRRARVERSRTRAQGLRGQGEESPGDAAAGSDDELVETEEVEATEGVATFADVAEPAEPAEVEELVAVPEVESAEAAEADAETADVAEDAVDETSSDELPPGAVAAPADGSIPEGHEIKANASSRMYHAPGSRYYDITIGELFFDTAESAEAAGYTRPGGEPGEDDN